MSLNTFKAIVSHPINKREKIRSIYNWLRWHIVMRLNPYNSVYPITSKSSILVGKKYLGANGFIYFGLPELDDMAFLLHFLRNSDYFVDAGANVGAYTILASSEIGSYSIAIEPIPSTYQTLCMNIVLNNIYERVKTLNLGLGKSKDTLFFTENLDTINHVVEKEFNGKKIKVNVNTLDNIMSEIKQEPILIKIDVEGYETEVIKGAHNLLSSKALKGIIIELNSLGERYGFEDSYIHKSLLLYGFKPYKYNPFEKKFTELETFGKHNTLYIRDINFVLERVLNSKKVIIKNVTI